MHHVSVPHGMREEGTIEQVSRLTAKAVGDSLLRLQTAFGSGNSGRQGCLARWKSKTRCASVTPRLNIVTSYLSRVPGLVPPYSNPQTSRRPVRPSSLVSDNWTCWVVGREVWLNPHRLALPYMSISTVVISLAYCNAAVA